MKIIIIIVLLASIGICKGQELNLVPIDSANFEIIADTLFDQYSIIPDSIKFDTEIYKFCPCAIDSLNGFVSYKSSSVFVKRNKCFFIYKTGSEYFINVGQMTDKKDALGKYIWKFSIKSIKDKTANQYISLTKNEISKAKVPSFESFVIVMDGTNHTFGDIEQKIYATTPTTNFSDSIEELIKFSQRIIRYEYR